jgi:hypothetical protein
VGTWQRHAGSYLRDADAAAATAAALQGVNKQLRTQIAEHSGEAEASGGKAGLLSREALVQELADVKEQLAAAKRRAARERLSACGRARCAESA